MKGSLPCFLLLLQLRLLSLHHAHLSLSYLRFRAQSDEETFRGLWHKICCPLMCYCARLESVPPSPHPFLMQATKWSKNVLWAKSYASLHLSRTVQYDWSQDYFSAISGSLVKKKMLKTTVHDSIVHIPPEFSNAAAIQRYLLHFIKQPGDLNKAFQQSFQLSLIN